MAPARAGIRLVTFVQRELAKACSDWELKAASAYFRLVRSDAEIHQGTNGGNVAMEDVAVRQVSSTTKIWTSFRSLHI